MGTWGSMVDDDQFPSSAGFEWDFYGGYRMPLGKDWTLDAGLLQYLYPGAGTFNTLEFYLGATWEWFQVKYSHSLSKQFFGVANARGSGYIDLTATYPIGEGLNLIGHIGRQRLAGSANDGDYTDYKIGVTYDWTGFTWGAAVVGASEDFAFTKGSRSKDLGGSGIVLSVSKIF